MKTSFDLIIAPLATEKSNGLVAMQKYVFKVHPDAGKIEIGRAVEELFKVKVKSVNIMNYFGKPKRAGRSMKMGRRSDWKKAVITLSEGTIEII